jgi:hypothetical protein
MELIAMMSSLNNKQLGFFFQFNFRIVQKFQSCGIEHNHETSLARILCMKINHQG